MSLHRVLDTCVHVATGRAPEIPGLELHPLRVGMNVSVVVNVGSTVNTLLLAYAGASMPLLLLLRGAAAVILVLVTLWAILQDFNQGWREPQRHGKIWAAALVDQKIQRDTTPEKEAQLADLQKIFIPFFTTKTGGHGIGLALAHRVIAEHGGANPQDRNVPLVVA